MEKDNKNVEKEQKSTKKLGGCTGKGFMPGKSGNPKGRKPNHHYFSDIAREILASKKIEIKIQGKDEKKLKKITMKTDETFNHALVVTLLHEALNGQIPAVKELIDRCEGKPVERVITAETTEEFLID